MVTQTGGSSQSTVASTLEATGSSEDGVGGVYNYSGGNRVITNYTEDETIELDVAVTGVSVSADNFIVTSADGTLTLNEVRGEVVSFTDSNGNIVAYSYMANEGGTVDGRGLSVFEVIIGANSTSNELIASGNGSSLYGGKGEGDNTLQGGDGQDTFLYTNGSGVIRSATTGDKINFGAESYEGFRFSNDDVIISSGEGDLLVQSIRDEVIDIADGNGNVTARVLMAGNGGDVKGDTIGGYLVMSGANEQSNIISAGNEGGSIYGGNGTYDTLIGGDGEDCFMFGYNSGFDTIYGAYSNDIINLMDVTLDNIVLSVTAGSTQISLASGAQLTVDGNNGAGYLIQGKIYDADLATNSFIERTNNNN